MSTNSTVKKYKTISYETRKYRVSTSISTFLHFNFDALEIGGHLFLWYQGKILEGIEEMCCYTAAGQ